MNAESAPPRFTDLGLPEALLRALADVGYETPSPIQAATIPPLLAGRDVLGQAQTGTGKTAAFALPILARIAAEERDPARRAPQALVLAPTRELAIQVAEAFQKYAHHLPGFQVLPIYGGQGYAPQLQALRRGVQVVVGTPGRVVDHVGRGSLDLSQLRCLVLDEADEMLRMGFIEDVETVLKATPETRQVALFSATMPSPIRRIAQTYLRDPVEVSIRAATTTAANIRQRYLNVGGGPAAAAHKLDALTRILEAEPFDAMIVFSRTKLGTEELAARLGARGIAAAAINGDMDQKQRERTIQRLRDGQVDVLVATDVAARGLDVERISHVLNYDIPYDTESYVHRIGRTGRAGRAGEAILFVTPRERGMLRAIERATRQPLEPMPLPSAEAVNEQRVARFLARIDEALAGEGLGVFRELLERYERERDVPAIDIAAAMASLLQGGTPLLMEDAPRVMENAPRVERWTPERNDRSRRPDRHGDRADAGRQRQDEGRPGAEAARRGTRLRGNDGGEAAEAPAFPASQRGPAEAPARRERPAPPSRHPREGADPATSAHRPAPRPSANDGEAMFADDAPAARSPQERAPRADRALRTPEIGMETFRIEVGHAHGVQPGNIVGAIANEADLESRYIGRIDIRDDFSLVDLPEGMPREILEHLKRVRVAGQPLRMRRATETGGGTASRGRSKNAAPRKAGFRPRPPRER